MAHTVLHRRWYDAGSVAIALFAGGHSLWVERPVLTSESGVWWWFDVVALVAATTLLLGRRRAPVGVALAVWGLGVVSPVVWGTGIVATFALAVRRPWPVAVGLSVGTFPISLLQGLIRDRAPEPLPTWASLAWVGAVIVATLASGAAVRARHQLMDSLVERAERAEAEAALRAEAARTGERTRIAREMHDVLAHRLSLVSMHAGALAHRSNPTRAEVADAVGVIRDGARAALVDLRAILGVLRDPDTGEGGAATAALAPQPTLDDLDRLVDEVRAAGTTVRLSRDADLDALPDDCGRALYRIAQEALTNAARHAHGQPVDVRVAGRPGAEVVLDVVNPLSVASGEGAGGNGAGGNGAGTGLLGVAERVELAGGRVLARGPEHDRFRLAVALPWPTVVEQVRA